jgi:hypothetical protein
MDMWSAFGQLGVERSRPGLLRRVLITVSTLSCSLIFVTSAAAQSDPNDPYLEMEALAGDDHRHAGTASSPLKNPMRTRAHSVR